MSQRPRSLRYEYELFVEREIENYKESIPRSAILKIGDDAVAVLQSQPQLALTEILLCAEVDRIIQGRLRLPSFATWRKRRLKALKEFSRPERWGFRADSALARAALSVAEGHVLVAGVSAEGPAIYLAANGCAVTAVDTTEDVLERVLNAAAEVGLTSRVRCVGEALANWSPDRPLNAVVVAAAALSGLSTVERARAIELLNHRLADCIDLQSQTKQAHWNVKGPHFIGLHELFDQIYEATEEYVDLIAERVVQLGGIAEGTVRVCAERSTLTEYPLVLSSGEEHVAALSDVLAQFSGKAREAIEELDDIGDPDSMDILTEVSRGVDKWLWFVEAHEQTRPASTGSARSQR